MTVDTVMEVPPEDVKVRDGDPLESKFEPAMTMDVVPAATTAVDVVMVGTGLTVQTTAEALSIP